jgi:hypothetical protein
VKKSCALTNKTSADPASSIAAPEATVAANSTRASRLRSPASVSTRLCLFGCFFERRRLRNTPTGGVVFVMDE